MTPGQVRDPGRRGGTGQSARPGFSRGTSAVVVFLAVLTMAPAAWPAAPQDPPAAAKRSFGPLEKSLLFPGWGQLSEKRYLEGAVFLAAELACLYGALAADHLGNENYALYRSAASMDETVRARALVEKYDTRRNRFLIAAAAVWALNLIDIFLIIKAKETERPALSLRIGRGTHQDIGITAAFRY